MKLPIFHLSLSVADLERSVAFYRRLFDAEVGRRTATFADIWLFDAQVTLYERDTIVADPHDHFGATVEHSAFQAIAERVLADPECGVVVPPRTGRAGTPQEEVKLMVTDPDGHRIELKSYPDPDSALAAGVGDGTRVVSATREIDAGAAEIFELIADPANQPRWDGNENLKEAPEGQRVRGAGQVFTMQLTTGSIRENHVVDFVEGRRIAWKPAEPGRAPPGHLWAWDLEALDARRTLVTHTYDWSELKDPDRVGRARATTADKLQASLDRLAVLAERR